MPKFKVGEEYWQTDKKCYAKYIKEDDDRIGGLIVTYRGDLNTYGIDCSLLIDTSHTMLTELGFEKDTFQDGLIQWSDDTDNFIHIKNNKVIRCEFTAPKMKEKTAALSQLMREQQ